MPGLAFDPEQGVNLLALDGGGVKGISTLIILQAIMERVKDYEIENKLNPSRDTRDPVDYFHLAAGTSTGGIIALMLFRLRMSVQKTIDEYEKIGPKVFGLEGESSPIMRVQFTSIPPRLPFWF
jgi:patatin-like phospholipase/acyl hydrolase